MSGSLRPAPPFACAAGLFSILVSGRGQLAVTSYGGLFRLVLEEGDEYYASTR